MSSRTLLVLIYIGKVRSETFTKYQGERKALAKKKILRVPVRVRHVGAAIIC